MEGICKLNKTATCKLDKKESKFIHGGNDET
jgi:hypothetical protein